MIAKWSPTPHDAYLTQRGDTYRLRVYARSNRVIADLEYKDRDKAIQFAELYLCRVRSDEPTNTLGGGNTLR